MTQNQQHGIDKHQNAAKFEEYAKKAIKVIICEDDDEYDEEALFCTVCHKIVESYQHCDACGDEICDICGVDDEGIVFCYECFVERQSEFEEDEW